MGWLDNKGKNTVKLKGQRARGVVTIDTEQILMLID
jgi:hypothetical protein